MGTRNLTMVIKNNEVKIAQYGQWDGYPGGQGKTALSFLRKVDLLAFSYQLDKCKFIDDKKQNEMRRFAVSIGITDGWMNMEQAQKYKQKYPLLSRDNGANILNLVNDSEEDVIWLADESDFANDSLMNEWTYVIDLDKNTFEVYRGFNKSPLHKHERFYSDSVNEGGYYPVKNVAIYEISNLPSDEEFVKLEEVESE